MKRAFPSLPFTLSPLILAAAIITACVVKADDHAGLSGLGL